MGTTWANGFGIWHVRVPRTPDAIAVAWAAISAELRAREARFDESRMRLQIVEESTTEVTYAEHWPDDTPGVSYRP